MLVFFIINNEVLYKILMLDFFDLRDYKHKLLSRLISAFISMVNLNKIMILMNI